MHRAIQGARSLAAAALAIHYAALVVVPESDVVVALATNGGNEAAGEVNAFTGIVDGVVRAVPSPP